MILALTGVPLVILSILAFILVLGIIIIVHEGGHFFFARRAGILCHEFSIGMGPAIYKKKFKETTFCIRAIPIGGYVSMAGEEVTSDLVKVGDTIGLNLLDGRVSEFVLDENLDAMVKGEVVAVDLYGKDGNPLYIELNDGFQSQYYEVHRDAHYVLKKDQKLQITPYDRSFESKTLWQRFLTLVAGPCMNFILAIIVYLIVSFASGVPNLASNEIGGVSSANSNLIVETGENTEYLLKPGDHIKEINGVPISNWNELGKEMDKLLENCTTSVELVVERNGEKIFLVGEEKKVECYTYIVSLGLSNIRAPKKELPEGIFGLVVGDVDALRYEDSGVKGEYPLQQGDIITRIKVDTVLPDKTIKEGEIVNVTSWGELVSIFKDVDIAKVHLEYYSYSKGGIVSINDSATLETYGDEVLNNQRIKKIQINIGISPTTHFDFFGSIGNAFENFWDDFTLIFRTLSLLLFPQASIRQIGVGDLSSFVGIYGLIQRFLASGILSLLALMAMLSVNIGVMNLLPIPALDGGRIVFLGYELVTKRKPSKKVENIINNVFFVLLMILFVYVTYNDILRMIRG